MHITCISDSVKCVCFGDTHCKTFDKVRFDYQGVCKYNMVSVAAQTGLPGFQVYSKNEYRYGFTDVSYVKYVEIKIGGSDIVRLTGSYESPDAVPVTATV